MHPLDLLILILATYYAAVTLAKLHGPFGLVERARHAVYRRRGFGLMADSPADPDAGREWSVWEWTRVAERKADMPAGVFAVIEHPDDDWLAAGVSCPLCMSLYCGTVLALAWYVGGAIGQAAVGVLAVAGGASMLFSVGRIWE